MPATRKRQQLSNHFAKVRTMSSIHDSTTNVHIEAIGEQRQNTTHGEQPGLQPGWPTDQPGHQHDAGGGRAGDGQQHDNPTEPNGEQPAENGPQNAGVSMLGLPLIVEVQGQSRQVTPAELQSEECRRQRRDELQALGGQPIFDLQHLLDWSDGDRW